jgi:4-hydroxy-4-methyl-2-oxoglutarate aldolase
MWMLCRTDEELFALVSASLYTAVIGDILDTLGYFHQFFSPEVRPIREDMRVIGRAMPVQIADVSGKQQRPFGLLTEALDQIRSGEVYIASGTLRCASWGEILTATAKKRGCRSAVIDGYHRDTWRVLEQDWPVFSRGTYAQDAAVRSQVIAYRCPIEVDGVVIEPGDLLFGDLDGVLIVPHEIEAEIVALALQNAGHEKVVRRDIEAGSSSTSAFQKYGVL